MAVSREPKSLIMLLALDVFITLPLYIMSVSPLSPGQIRVSMHGLARLRLRYLVMVSALSTMWVFLGC